MKKNNLQTKVLATIYKNDENLIDAEKHQELELLIVESMANLDEDLNEFKAIKVTGATIGSLELSENTDDKTLDLKINDDVTYQLGQELGTPVVKLTANDLSNGKLYRIIGVDPITNQPTIAFSDNRDESTAYADGMATEDIISGGGVKLGTKIGKARHLNTAISGAVEGNYAYMGIDGNFTAIEPVYPSKKIIIGKFGAIHPTEGYLLLDLSSVNQKKFNEIDTELEKKAMQFVGICQRTPLYVSDIIIDYDAKTLTIPTVNNGIPITPQTPLRYFTNGNGILNVHLVTEPVVFTFTKTNGDWFFYFNANDEAIATQTPWTVEEFESTAPVFILRYNNTLSGAERGTLEQQEFHKSVMSADSHVLAHLDGSKWMRGADGIYNDLATGTPNADGRNTVLSITNGKFTDDGLEWEFFHDINPTEYFEQNLGEQSAGSLNATNAGLFKIRTSNAGGVTFLPATRFPFLWNSGNNRPQYLTTTQVATDVPNGNYMVYFYYTEPDRKTGQSVKATSAPIVFTTLALAQAFVWENQKSYYADLRSNEVRQLYKRIYYVKHSNPSPYDVGTKYCVCRQTDDIRTQKNVTVPAASGVVPATNVATTAKTIITSTNVESALQEVNTILGGGALGKVLTGAGVDSTPTWEDPSGGGGGVSNRYLANGIYQYFGTANSGTLDSAEAWLITRTNIDTITGVITTATAVDVAWDDVLTAIYS